MLRTNEFSNVDFYQILSKRTPQEKKKKFCVIHIFLILQYQMLLQRSCMWGFNLFAYVGVHTGGCNDNPISKQQYG